MNVNYIILAHKNPDQLKRLISKLSSTWTHFYIHIDRNENIKAYEKKLNEVKNIDFLKNRDRHLGTWGHIGIVKATLKAMQRIVADGRTGYVVLLSGQDYPLQDNKSIQDFFAKNNKSHFITSYSLPHNQLENGGLPRIHQYKINKSGKRGHFLFLNSIFDSGFYNFETLGKLNFLRKSGGWKDIFQVFKKRKFPEYLKPYAGSQWWALNIPTIIKILQFINEHPDYLEYHRYSLLPDEMFFQSIVVEIANASKTDLLKSLTYVNWERPLGPLPVTFKEKDFEELKEASKNHLFARKFDVQLDEEVLNLIDKLLLNNNE